MRLLLGQYSSASNSTFCNRIRAFSSCQGSLYVILTNFKKYLRSFVFDYLINLLMKVDYLAIKFTIFMIASRTKHESFDSFGTPATFFSFAMFMSISISFLCNGPILYPLFSVCIFKYPNLYKTRWILTGLFQLDKNLYGQQCCSFICVCSVPNAWQRSDK